MGQKPPRALTSRDFTRGSFQYVVLSLREACVNGLGVVACAVWHPGGPEYRPWKDGLIVATVAMTIQCLAILLRMTNQRGTIPEDMWGSSSPACSFWW